MLGPDGKSAAEVMGRHKVYDPELGEETRELASLWSEGPVLVHLVRRFGCPLCREAAAELSTLRRPGLSMVAIGCQETGWSEFHDGGFFSGKVLVDKDRAVFSALGLHRSGIWDGFGYADWRSWAATWRSLQRGVPGDLKGDGMQMGGTFVILPGGECIYDHRMRSPGDKPDVNEIERVLEIRLRNEEL